MKRISGSTIRTTLLCTFLVTVADLFTSGKIHALTWISNLLWWATIALTILWLVTRLYWTIRRLVTWIFSPSIPRYANYEDYLRSDRWQELRREALLRDGYRCRICDATGSLNIHHRYYPNRWGLETVDDLTTLCEDCHSAVHSGQIHR
jgi:hypothetical protein